ncbi:MAG TPA: hypothetical protein VHZ97_18825 [Pseudonocardiaceae bacterium]|jgi:hypothetical protein|nr:hypothetical protein [Pseudonocardiaceae bacterium]
MNGRCNTGATVSRRKRGWARLVVGLVVGFVGLVLAAVGGFGLAMATGNSGYVDLGNASYHGNGYAVITDGYNWADANLAGASYDTVRVQVTADTANPIFIGVARADAVQHYLTDVEYSTATSVGNEQVAYDDHHGSAPSTPPAHAGMWLASATGSGTQTFQFNAHATSGNLVLVAMNADGTPTVAGTIRTAATMPSLTGISAGVLAVGVLASAGGVLLLIRRRAA